ncbi:voltage dependent anion channel 4 [Carex rostrata]
MSNGPVPFNEVGKRAKDLLYKDYNFDHKFLLTLASKSGLGLTASGVKIKQVFVGDISSKYQNGRTTVDVKVDSNSTVSTTVTVNEAITGLKSSFSFKIPDHKSGKLNLQYLNEKIALNCGIGTTTTPLIDCAASVGIKELSFGAEVGFDSASASFTKYNCGVGYNKPDFSASLVLADKGETLKASYIHLYNPERGDAVAAELTHRFNSGDNSFAFGSSHAIDPLTTLKTRVCDRGRVAVLCQHQWRPKSFITLSTEYDPKAFSEPSKVGLALALKP